MNKIERQGIIDGLILDDVENIMQSYKKYEDVNYIMYLLEFHKGYAKWTNNQLLNEWHERL